MPFFGFVQKQNAFFWVCPFALSHDSSVSCDLIPLSLLPALAVVVRYYLKSKSFFTSVWIIAQRECHIHHTYTTYTHTFLNTRCSLKLSLQTCLSLVKKTSMPQPPALTTCSPWCLPTYQEHPQWWWSHPCSAFGRFGYQPVFLS